MTSIDLPEPFPRSDCRENKPRVRSCTRREYLQIPPSPPDKSVWEVLQERRTHREFGQLTRIELSSLLWFSVKTRETTVWQNGSRWQSRPYPSAGGVHPIDVLVVERTSTGTTVAWYDAVAHALDSFQTQTPDGVDTLLCRAESIVAMGEGTLLWFVADAEAIGARYANPESLVWRDSGAALMAIYMVSEALGLSCCGMGATGTAEIRAIVAGSDRFVGVGGCVIGSRIAALGPSHAKEDS